MSTPHDGLPPSWRTALVACSIIALVAMLVLRVSGPCDLYDQTQPKTIAYTTDIIVNGGWHWILPIERGDLPATKPPLYNWLAVPGVRWLGFDSEIAHKLPSVAALLACWLIIVRLGRRLDRDAGADESLGWLAGMMFVANYAAFKLGYLARPDMLLTLWLLIAWASATRVFITKSQSTGAVVVFWLAITLAGLTKGPAALVGVAYAVVAARVVGGRWGAIRSLHPIIGLVMSGVICGAWVYAAWMIDPTHVRDQLWFNEIYGRITGSGTEGTNQGTREWLSEVHYQAFYFVTRFTPWSLAALIGVVALWRGSHAKEAAPTTDMQGWMRGAAVFMLMTVGLFSLSVGKRPDYVAVAVPQASLLAAWWWLRGGGPGVRRPWLAPVAAAITLGLLTWYDRTEVWAPQPRFGDAIMRFAREANAKVAADPAPVYTASVGTSPLQALMGIATPDARADIDELIARGETFWVVAGRTEAAPREFGPWVQHRRMPADVVEAARSAELPRTAGWQTQATLWRVTPRQSPRQTPGP